MRTGKILIVMAAVLAVAGAAGAQTPSSCAELSQYGNVTVIDFEGFTTQPGAVGAFELNGNEFPGITLTPQLYTDAGGQQAQTELWVGEPTSGSNNCVTFYGNDFVPVSGVAVFSPGNCYEDATVSPTGSVLVDFDTPVLAIGLTFLDAEGGYSNVEAFDEASGGGNSLGQAVAQNVGDNSQAFRFVYDSDGNILSAIIELGILPQDGVGIDDLCYVVPPDCERDLIAGGGNEASAIDVGSVVTTDHGDGSWTVAYNTIEGWELTELHLHVTCDNCGDDGFPLNKSGNPQIGHFFYTAYPEPGTQSFVFPDDADGFDEVIPLCGNFKDGFIEGECECPLMAAHAVVTQVGSCADVVSGYLYGIENGSGDLYKIDLAADTVTLIEDLNGAYGTGSYPNGAAWDPVNERLYFTASNGDLYFWEEGVGVTFAGAVAGGQIADGAFSEGKYYYIANNTDEIQEVMLNPDGTFASQSVVCSNIAGGKSLGFGDIVVHPNGQTLYVSAGVGGVGLWYIVDLANECATTEITKAAGEWVQLAYGASGALYGQNTTSGDFYTIDPLAGAFSDPFTVFKSDGTLFKSNDLTSDAVCVPYTETAWGEGEEFVDSKSWAMYFDACACPEPEPGVE